MSDTLLSSILLIIVGFAGFIAIGRVLGARSRIRSEFCLSENLSSLRRSEVALAFGSRVLRLRGDGWPLSDRYVIEDERLLAVGRMDVEFPNTKKVNVALDGRTFILVVRREPLFDTVYRDQYPAASDAALALVEGATGRVLVEVTRASGTVDRLRPVDGGAVLKFIQSESLRSERRFTDERGMVAVAYDSASGLITNCYFVFSEQLSTEIQATVMALALFSE